MDIFHENCHPSALLWNFEVQDFACLPLPLASKASTPLWVSTLPFESGS